jgi:glycosyltransferase involved in cell wall biosynthesis
VVGGRVPFELIRDAPVGVEYLSGSDSLDVVYKDAIVALAPWRFGPSLNPAVGEALIRGVPMVMTPAVASGAEIRHGITGLVAADPKAFAEHICRLAADKVLWAEIAAAGQVHAKSVFDPTALNRAIASLLAK